MFLRQINVFLFLFSIFSSFQLSASQIEQKGPIILVVGTRPEAIKVIPVYQALKAAGLPVLFCSTGQHKELLDDILKMFNLIPDYDFKIMKQNQDLLYITEEVLKKASKLFEETKPSLVIVQGDTTSAMSAALAAFYLKIPVAHIEAGLRTYDIYAPFPEEMNRLLISKIASIHFAPTKLAVSRLEKEGISSDTIFLTGNTVLDTLYSIRNKIEYKEITPSPLVEDIVRVARQNNQKLLLLTTHRRENFGKSLEQIFTALKHAMKKYANLHVVYLMHPNPHIRQTFDEVFVDPYPQMSLLPPQTYSDMVYLLAHVDGVATDSGGLQEEAISMNKMTLILRNETDRPEGLSTGLARLVGDDEEKIALGIHQVLHPPVSIRNVKTSPYGDGSASKKIQEVIQKFYQNL